MKPVAVLYATREGHTARVAAQLVAGLRKRGLDAFAQQVATFRPDRGLDACGAVVLAASVHAGRHEREMIRFVRDRRAELDAIPNAFVSVTLSQAGVQRTDATPEERARFAADVRAMTDRFQEQTGWRSKRAINVAGALAYSKYGFVVRLMMKRIARKAGGSTDTTHDRDYTDWTALDAFAAAVADDVSASVHESMSPADPHALSLQPLASPAPRG